MRRRCIVGAATFPDRAGLEREGDAADVPAFFLAERARGFLTVVSAIRNSPSMHYLPRMRNLRNVYPVAHFVDASFWIENLIFQHPAVFLDDFARCDVGHLARNQDFLEPEFLRFRKRKFEDFVAVSLSALARADVVADVASDLFQMFRKLMANTRTPDEFSFVDEPVISLRHVPLRKILTFCMT